MKHFIRSRAVMLALVLVLLSSVGCGDTGDDNMSQQGSFGKLDTTKKNDTSQSDISDTLDNSDISEMPNISDNSDTSDTPNTSDDSDTSEAPTEFAYSEAAQNSIDGLYFNYWHERFAASYLGYREEGDTTDLTEWLHNEAPTLASFWPFLLEIPEEDILGEYGDLYCVVPLDESLTFTVKSVEWEVGGNGSVPHYSEPLYYPKIDHPFLMYITHTRWVDETNLTLEYEQPDGFVGTWCPTYDPETGCLKAHTKGRILDFASLYDVGDYVPHLGNNDPAPDSEWLPPTNVGLGNTTWYSENGWVLEFKYDESAGIGYGDMVLYQPEETDDGILLTTYYDGTWWMDYDRLCLGVYDGNCPFPILISPSGEKMVIMKSDDGSVLPFFEPGQGIIRMTLSYE